MNKLKKAIGLSLDKWAQELDGNFATTNFDENEKPCFRKTPEQMKAEANEIWEKARAGLLSCSCQFAQRLFPIR